MDEPKLTRAPVDVERLVRNLLDAFDSIKTKRAPLACATAKEPVSDQREATSAPQDRSTSTPAQTVEEFHADREPVLPVEAIPQEPKTLPHGASVGSLPRKPDAPLMLRPIRQPANPLQLREAFSPAQIQRRYHKLEPSIPYLFEMSETIRRAALAKLELESLKASERRETAWRRIYTMLIWRNHSSPRFGTKSRQP